MILRLLFIVCISCECASAQTNFTVFNFDASGNLQSITPSSAQGPSIIDQPQNESGILGESASFSVVATGTALDYQWLLNGTNIIGATNDTYLIPVLQLTDNGHQFSVIVSNSAGAVTSSVASLNISLITTQPVGQTAYGSSSITLTVGASVNYPLGYQWYWNGQMISGATSATLALTNLTINQGGPYSVVLTYASGTVTSQTATVTVNPSIVGYWPMDEGSGSILHDTSGNGNNGVISNATWVGGVAGTALNFNGSNALVAISNSTSLSNLNGPVTLVAWVNQQPLIAGEGWGYVVGCYSPETYIRTTSSDYEAGSGSAVASGGNPVPDYGSWVQLAAVYDGSFWYLYRNGVLLSSVSSTTGVAPGSQQWAIGAWGCNCGRYFNGVIDEAGVFGSALSALTIQMIGSGALTLPQASVGPQSQSVVAGTTANFSVTAGGTGPFIYQWQFNGMSIYEATNATLTLTEVTTNQAGSYRVLIANAAGSITSSNATLSVLGIPFSFVTTPSAILYSNGQLHLQLTGLTGQGPILLEASTNLTQWTPIFTNPSASGTIPLIDSNASNYPHRYYRATITGP
jgi:hypothetical protein